MHDPTHLTGQTSAWAVNIESSSNILIFGKTFFQALRPAKHIEMLTRVCVYS